MTDTANHATHAGRSSVLSEVRIVLLGSRYSGKSSTGNTILGCEAFRDTTEECVSQEGVVFGRKVTVVEVPAWRGRYFALESLETTRRRLEANLSLCLPGPHALLMVIPLETIRGKEWLVEELLEYPIESIWGHTIVLITGGDALEDTNIETLIDKEVREIIRRCGNRYHVMDNKSWGRGHQVEDLLEKIEEMVAAQDGRCFEVSEEISRDLERRSREVGERARRRLQRAGKRRKTLQGLLAGVAQRPSDLNLFLLAGKYAGKSSAANTLLGREEFGQETRACQRACVTVAGRRLTVIDTVGWDWRSLEDTSESVRQELLRSLSLRGPGPVAFLLVIPSPLGMTENDRQALVQNLELLGKEPWQRALVLFVMGEGYEFNEVSVEEHTESWRALRWVVDMCGNRYHVLDVDQPVGQDQAQVVELLEKVEEMVVGWDRELLLEALERSEESNAQLRALCASQQRALLQMEEMIEGHAQEMELLSQDSEEAVN
ncbi:GTPase IMAP family member 8-like isoform X1 [Alosa sapidissima]|uniref:GTPase IMAP family member 8-like isoform X1 n=1 Tax=Alosa sapidissima TaxID=34773 RepID=UPI001C0878D9|nr:GTPase IMAP family member 8-like isoform X1 [Alosa sapidissima]